VTGAPIEIVPLGGLGEFGRNLLWLRRGASSILVDVGVSFPDETFPGIDRIAPDFSPLSGERVDAVILTHGHEDHIGALPLLRETFRAQVYGFPFTLVLRGAGWKGEGLRKAWSKRGPRERARRRVRVHVLPRLALRARLRGHPDRSGGPLDFHSGDQARPGPARIWRAGDAARIAAAVGEGVDFALVDSTNAERAQAGPRRKGDRGQQPRGAFPRGSAEDHPDDWSHVARIAQAVESGRRRRPFVALLGRSMRTVAESPSGAPLGPPAGGPVTPGELAGCPRRERLLCLTSGARANPSRPSTGALTSMT
jgi:ribonuclease J